MPIVSTSRRPPSVRRLSSRVVVRRFLAILAFLVIKGEGAPAADAPPKSLDPRLAIHLFAEAPQIVTPTDLDIDHFGRVWAIESNTHFRPAGYKGHSSDRVLVFRDDNQDGKADRVDMFADGFVHAMSLAVRFGDGVYVATRKEIFHLTDADGDGKADGRRVILRLDTPGDYPHNGLAGFAFDGLGYLYIGLGENLGADYRLIGTDGRTLSGGGEGGSVFRCRPDGSDLTLWATGFWNPHASCVDAFGRMFTVDNDPDDRPPCRMLQIIPGGDYGYRFRNGRRGIHPFTAWDGELPGTLQMVSGTGEAPCGIVAYESDVFPSEYRGTLLVTSWGDHRIDRFRLRPQGTSLTSKAEPLIVGGENFRPVGLALAPDGSLFATDWVLKDYTLHGHGRIWRIGPTTASRTKADDLAAVPRLPLSELRQKLDSPRLDIRRLSAGALAERDRPFLEAVARDRKAPPRPRLEASWALARRSERAPPHTPARSSLNNPELPRLWPDLEPAGSEMSGDALLGRLKHPSGVNPSIELWRLMAGFDKLVVQKDPALLERILDLDDRFVFAAVVQALAKEWAPGECAARLPLARPPSPRLRLALLLAARQTGTGKLDDPADALSDPDFGVRRAAIQWVGEERLSKFRKQIERQLADPTTTPALFEAALASLEMLNGVKRVSKDEFSGADYALRLARDERAPDAVRAMALRMVPPGHKGLDLKLLKRLLASPSFGLRFEAVRTLRETAFPETPALLRGLAIDERVETGLRLEALAGLAAVLQRDEHDSATLTVLRRLLAGANHDLQIAALRALRRSLRDPQVKADVTALAKAESAEPSREWADQVALAYRISGLPLPKQLRALAPLRPSTEDGWIRLAATGGNADAGRRLFEHPNAGGCFHCHTVNGRGGRIGPDLSVIARSADRRKLADSIVRPSREIAPQFTSWTFVTRDGRVVAGMVVEEDREGRVQIGTAEGNLVQLNAADVEERHPQNKSVMPERLVDALTPGEFRDLVAFLAGLK